MATLIEGRHGLAIEAGPLHEQGMDDRGNYKGTSTLDESAELDRLSLINGHCAAAYYRALGNFNGNGSGLTSQDECRSLANDYKISLNAVLEFLTARNRQNGHDDTFPRMIRAVEKLQSLLQSDMISFDLN